jgi:hypothetical protein
MNKRFYILGLLIVVLFSLFLVFNFSYAQYGLDKFEGDSDSVMETERDAGEVIGGIINVLLGIIGVVLVALIVYGGVVYATSMGNEERVGMAKKVLTYSFIGVLIIASSFAISIYVVPALFGDEDGGDGTTAGGDGGDAGDGENGDGASQFALGGRLIDRGNDMIEEGEDMTERGEAMLADDDETNDDEGQELINDGRARVEQGRETRSSGSAMQSSAGSGTTRQTDIDGEPDDCKQLGDSPCGVLRNFCCDNLECSSWLPATGECVEKEE